MHYLSTKTYTHEQGLSACFRQWRAKSHCRFLHGYALSFKLTFTADHLDENGWVQDFGSLKPIKAWLESTFDHKTCIAADDPNLTEFRELEKAGLIQPSYLPAVGCEAFASLAFNYVSGWLKDRNKQGENTVPHIAGLNGTNLQRVWLVEVEVREHGGNSAIVRETRII